MAGLLPLMGLAVVQVDMFAIVDTAVRGLDVCYHLFLHL
jgi:hypothetical protein